MKRRKRLYLLMALVTAFLCIISCSKTDIYQFSAIRFNASMEAAPSTRTSYTGDGDFVDGNLVKERIDWSTGDLITIYSPQAVLPDETTRPLDYVVRNYAQHSATVSRATIEASGDDELQWGTGEHTFYAMYPSRETSGFSAAEKAKIALSETQMTGTIPAAQTLTWNGLVGAPDMKYAWMFATATASAGPDPVNLMFYPKFTAFEFSVRSGENDSVELTSFTLETTADNGVLAGDFTLTNTTGTINVATDASSTINVNLAGKTVTTGNDLTFTVLALPVDITDLKITFVGPTIGTRSLLLKTSNGTPLTFAACKKYRIKGINFPSDITAGGEDIEWDLEGIGEDIIWDIL